MQLKSIHKPMQDAFGLGHDLGKLLQRASTAEFLGIVDHRFQAKLRVAFGINLQRQLAAVQLEDRQIIRRFLAPRLPIRRTSLSAGDTSDGACTPGSF